MTDAMFFREYLVTPVCGKFSCVQWKNPWPGLWQWLSIAEEQSVYTCSSSTSLVLSCSSSPVHPSEIFASCGLLTRLLVRWFVTKAHIVVLRMFVEVRTRSLVQGTRDQTSKTQRSKFSFIQGCSTDSVTATETEMTFLY